MVDRAGYEGHPVVSQVFGAASPFVFRPALGASAGAQGRDGWVALDAMLLTEGLAVERGGVF